MLFTIGYTITPNARDASIKKFLQTGGMPPEGIQMLSRYHNVDGSGGIAVCETDDAALLASFALDWTGLMDIKITPVVEDDTMGGIMGPRDEAGEFD